MTNKIYEAGKGTVFIGGVKFADVQSISYSENSGIVPVEIDSSANEFVPGKMSCTLTLKMNKKAARNAIRKMYAMVFKPHALAILKHRGKVSRRRMRKILKMAYKREIK